MKKIIVITSIILLILTGCSTQKTEKITVPENSQTTTTNYMKEIKKLTDKEIYHIIIDDFENNGERDAFILVKDKKESVFELWFLTPDSNKKIVDSFIAATDTSIKILEEDKKYCLLNIAQTRQNDEMQAIIYGVSGHKAEKLFSKKKLNFFIENGELYACNYSYSVLEPEFNEWMSLSEQKYHFRWDSKQKSVVEYEAKVISETQFSNILKSEELKENINHDIQKRYFDNIKDIEYSYLIREDESVDINLIVTLKEGSRHKHYVTVSDRDNILETDVQLLEGNKEKSLIKSLDTTDRTETTKNSKFTTVSAPLLVKLLKNKVTFYDTACKKNIYLKDYTSSDGTYMDRDRNGKYSYVEKYDESKQKKVTIDRWGEADMDSDGKKEVLLQLSNSNILVLHSEDETVYGYAFPFRGMEVKEDGTFTSSGGALINDIGTLKFDGRECFFNELCVMDINTQDNTKSVYRIDGKNSTQEDVLLYLKKQEEKKEMLWNNEQ